MTKPPTDPVVAELVNDESGPEYSYLPPTRVQRAARWVAEREFALLVLTIVVMLILSIPLRWFGWSYVAVFFALAIGFLAGWACARRYWLRSGVIPKL